MFLYLLVYLEIVNVQLVSNSHEHHDAWRKAMGEMNVTNFYR